MQYPVITHKNLIFYFSISPKSCHELTYNNNKVIGHPYITSDRGLGGWVYKMASFVDILYCIYIDIIVVGGWVRKSPKLFWRNTWMDLNLALSSFGSICPLLTLGAIHNRRRNFCGHFWYPLPHVEILTLIYLQCVS